MLIVPALGHASFNTVSSLFSTLDSPTPDPILTARWPEIIASRLYTRLPSDTTVWTASPSGRFSVKSAWNATRIPQPTITWHHLAWATSSHPRFSFVTWLAAIEALTLRTKVADWGISPERSCYFCNSIDETFDHLFFGCTSLIPFGNMCYCYAIIGETPFPPGKENLDGLVLISLAPPSWRASNSSASLRSSTAYGLSAIYSRALKNEAHHYSVIVLRIIEDTRVKFSHSAAGWVAINCDGSIRPHGGGYGCLGRNQLGAPLFAIAGGTAERNVLRMELIAIRVGLHKARCLGMERILCYSDSLLAIQILNGHVTIPWTTFDLVHDVWDLRDHFHSIDLHFHVRKTKFCADFLAGFLHHPNTSDSKFSLC
ncbi:uncharacterized protein LOC122671123 [Telopea speciosissima]|uniref:uncharacterized protein LOC122671123 n=1 Tax=Telopea speciosissima TaxID=54955 RepID=UPI001CC5B59A|nr:uncharacterized protein LOC122671123 [Telopea speciosissima]